MLHLDIAGIAIFFTEGTRFIDSWHMDLLQALGKGNNFMLRVFRNIVIVTPLASRS